MAQTKTSAKKAKTKRPAATAGTKSKAAGNSRSSSSRPKANVSSQRGGARNGSSAQSAGATIKAARDTVDDAGRKAASATGKAASKAKVPLIAGGAALVGAASGIAITAARSKNTKVLGMSLPKTRVKISSKDLAKAADRVAGAGEQIGRVSTGIREIQGQNGAGRGEGRPRSPIEVVIQGLTRRH